MKFTNTANIGDMIKAKDFVGMEDYFLTGVVLDKGPLYQEFEGRKVYVCDGYTVKVVGGDAETKPGRLGKVAYVPFETMMDFAGRVELVATKEEVEIVMTNNVEIH